MLQTQTKDQRRFPRRLLDQAVSVQTGNQEHAARLTDISCGGAFIESREHPARGSTLALDFTLPFPKKGIRVRFRLRAQVLRTTSHNAEAGLLCASGYAVGFLNLKEKERFCLQTFSDNAA